MSAESLSTFRYRLETHLFSVISGHKLTFMDIRRRRRGDLFDSNSNDNDNGTL